MVERSIRPTRQISCFGPKQHWFTPCAVMGLVPWHSPLNPTNALLERRVHFHLSKTTGVQRVRHDKQPSASSPETSFQTFLTKGRTLSNLKMSLHRTSPALLSLLFLLFKFLLFLLKRFMYFYFLGFVHAIPYLDPNLPLTPLHLTESHPQCPWLPWSPSQCTSPRWFSLGTPQILLSAPSPWQLPQWQTIINYLFKCNSHFPNQILNVSITKTGIS